MALKWLEKETKGFSNFIKYFPASIVIGGMTGTLLLTINVVYRNKNYPDIDILMNTLVGIPTIIILLSIFILRKLYGKSENRWLHLVIAGLAMAPFISIFLYLAKFG